MSLHCAPAISAHAGYGLSQLRHLEYFHAHLRIEDLLFDGVLVPVDGRLHPDLSRAGHGLALKPEVAQRYADGSRRR